MDILSNLWSKIPRSYSLDQFDVKNLGLEITCAGYSSILLLGISLAVSVASLCSSNTCRLELRRKRLHEALLSVLIPTSTAWPATYSVLLDKLTQHQSAETIQLVACNLLKSVYAGAVELRSTQELSQLLSDGMKIYGCQIRLGWNVHSRCSVLKWLLMSQLPSLKYQKFERLKFRDYTTPLTTNHPPLDVVEIISFSDLFSTSATSILLSDVGLPSLYLDLVSYPDLESMLRAFQSRLKPGQSATIEFTTTLSSISFLTDGFMSCSLPFLPRNYLGNGNIQRTSTPLLTSCHQVARMLISDSSTMIDSITNATNRSIFALKALRHKMAADRSVRSALIERWDEHGWREHVFLIDWEVELLVLGLLTRWSIVIQKQAAYKP